MKATEVFDRHSIKVTKARIKIYNIIKDKKQGLKADDIYDICRENNFDINLSTVYRTLDIFEINKIVDKYDSGDGCYRYFINEDSHKHILECSICHKEIELDCPMRKFEEMVKDETGFVVLQHKLTMKGICKECMEKECIEKKKDKIV